MPYASENRIALDFIRDVYVVEHDAIAASIAGKVGTPVYHPYIALADTATDPIGSELMGSGRIWYGFS